MSTNFGWHYPAGAENDPNAPWNEKEECDCDACENGHPFNCHWREDADDYEEGKAEYERARQAEVGYGQE